MLDNILNSTVLPATSTKFLDADTNILDKPPAESSSEFNFEDFLDVFNPLHHIPIVSEIYKDKAEDDISTHAKAVGDIFYGLLTGGILGVFGAIGNAILKQETNKDMSEHLIALITDDEKNTSLTSVQTTIPSNNLVNSRINSYSDNYINSLTHKDISTKKTDQGKIANDDWAIRMKQIFGDEFV